MNSTTAHNHTSGQGELDHTTHYEVLRTYAGTRRAPASRDGLVVLLRQGLAAWMDARSRFPAPPSREVQVSEQLQPTAFSDAASSEVVLILTAMTLAHIREVLA